MSQCVLVSCRACGGTGYGREIPVCDVCLGQMHVAVDRANDGGVPDGEREWRSSDLGPVPDNPLIRRSDAARRA